jgi:hypothetical protein
MQEGGIKSAGGCSGHGPPLKPGPNIKTLLFFRLERRSSPASQQFFSDSDPGLTPELGQLRQARLAIIKSGQLTLVLMPSVHDRDGFQCTTTSPPFFHGQ